MDTLFTPERSAPYANPNYQKHKEVLDVAYERLKPSLARQDVSYHKRLVEENLYYHVLSDPEWVIKKIQESPHWIEDNTKNNYLKFVSKLLKVFTLEEKRISTGQDFSEDDGGDVGLGYSEEEIPALFNDLVHSPYKREIHKIISNVDEEQRMTKKDYDNFVSKRDLERTSIERLKNLTLENIIDRQFDVALAMYIFASNIRRLDIGTTLIYPQQGNVMLSQDCSEVFIKQCNKSKERNVEIKFSPNVIPYIRMLKDARVKNNQKFLFMKIKECDYKTGEILDTSPNCDWFGTTFTRRMKKIFDKNVTNKIIRLSLGIYFSERDNGDYSYQRWIESVFGHSYETHQRFYNAFKTFEQQNIPGM